MQTREWILTVAVIVVPLIIAAVVTLWSLDQVRYRPKRRRPTAGVARETSTRSQPHASEGSADGGDWAPSGDDKRMGRGHDEAAAEAEQRR